MAQLRTRRLGLSILLLPVLLLAGVGVYAQIEGDRGIPPIASSGDFEVRGISVNTRGKNADEARESGWREAQRQGWIKLWREKNRNSAAPKLSDAELDAIVSAIVVEEEQIGPRRYVARLGVLFDRARAGQILGVRGSSLRSAPLLVIPVYWSGSAPQVFENRTPWQAAWARYRTADSMIDYVRPFGSGSDSLLVNAAQTGRRSRIWWRLILDQFGAADVITPVAVIERQWPGGPIVGKFAARFGPDNRLIGSFQLRTSNSSGLDAMLDEAIARFDALYSGALQRGALRPDPSLIIEQPAEIDESDLIDSLAEEGVAETGTETSAPASQQTYSVQFATPDVASVSAGERAVRGIPGVASASTSSLALGGTSVMRVVFSGDVNALRAALEARGWQVQQGGSTLRISRADGG